MHIGMLTLCAVKLHTIIIYLLSYRVGTILLGGILPDSVFSIMATLIVYNNIIRVTYTNLNGEIV